MIRKEVDIEIQYGIVPGRGTTDTIYIIRQLQEEFLWGKKLLYFMFFDLEKSFDRVPREVVCWGL